MERMWGVFGVVVLVLGLWSGSSGVKGAPQVPCYFIFGDSLVDNGNNNQLQSLARADYLPYGIDFGGRPTGRFSNGKTTVDVICEILMHLLSLILHALLPRICFPLFINFICKDTESMSFKRTY